MKWNAFIVALLAVLTGVPAKAEPPVAVYLFPAGAQRGTTTDLVIGGLFLQKKCNLEIVGEGIQGPKQVERTRSTWYEGPLLPLPESQRQEDYPQAMAARFLVGQNAEPGVRSVRLWTSQGVTNALPFVVGELPEIVEKESDTEPTPLAVVAPVTINGRIFPRENIDIYAVKLQRGEVLTCAVDAAKLGSPLQTHLEIRDGQERRLAETGTHRENDPKLTFQAPEEGIYQVRIRDIRFEGGPAFVYRLTLRKGPAIEGIFPLGGRRGSDVAFDLRGLGLPKDRVTVHLPPHSTSPFTTKLSLDPTKPSPVVFDLDDLVEVTETDAVNDPVKANFLTVPAIGNGRISRSGETDRWSFSARRGEIFEIELRAARLGSLLLGVLTVHDATGKEVAKAEPGPNGDPALRFTAAQDGLYRIQIADRFRSRGGPAFAYRLRVDRPVPDFELQLAASGITIPRGGQSIVKVTANRLGGFNGPIEVRFVGLPAGVSSTKSTVLAANQNSIDIPLKADADAPIVSANIQVLGIGFQPNGLAGVFLPTVRAASYRGPDGLPNEPCRLVVAMPTPFKIVGDYVSNQVPRGTVYSRHYRIVRNGYIGPIEIAMADRQARHLQGASGPILTVPADKNEFDYPVQLPPWMETGRTCRVCVMATGTVTDAAGASHFVTFSSREQNEQIIAVVEPERLGISLTSRSVRVEPGRPLDLAVAIHKGDGVQGKAVLELLVPDAVQGVRAATVTVPDTANQGILHIVAERQRIGRVPVVVRVTVTDHGKPITAEAKLELVVPR